MPFTDGEETREAFVDAVVVLGDDSIWCDVSTVSIPFIGGSGGRNTLAVCGGNSACMEVDMCSGIEADTTSIEETVAGCNCIDKAKGSAGRSSGGNIGEAD